MKRHHTNPPSKNELDIRQKVSIILKHIEIHGVRMIPSGFENGGYYESWEMHFSKHSSMRATNWNKAIKRVKEKREAEFKEVLKNINSL